MDKEFSSLFHVLFPQDEGWNPKEHDKEPDDKLFNVISQYIAKDFGGAAISVTTRTTVIAMSNIHRV